jgi:hypothetical protein
VIKTVRFPTTAGTFTNPAPGNGITLTATCDEGQTVLGGGHEFHRGTLPLDRTHYVWLIYSKPTATGDGWTVQLQEVINDNGTYALSVYAVCTAPSPAP